MAFGDGTGCGPHSATMKQTPFMRVRLRMCARTWAMQSGMRSEGGGVRVRHVVAVRGAGGIGAGVGAG